jgi:hypothetical protein
MQVDWYRIRDVGSYRMPQVTVAVRHFDLPQMPFFGLGNDSSLDDRSLYKLTETELPILADFPLGSGLTLSAQLNTLFAASDPSSTFTSTFSQATAPGIDASTTHMVPGLAVTYRSPDALYGFSSDGRVSYEAYQTLSGGAFTFDRVTARMAVHYGIEESPSPRRASLTCEACSARAASASGRTWSSASHAPTMRFRSISSRHWAAATSTTKTG